MKPDQDDIFTQNYTAGKTQLYYQWIHSDLDTPISAFLKLAEKTPYSFLLESVEGGEKLGRYTIIGLMPDIIWTCADYKSHGTNPIDDLRSILKKSHIDVDYPTLPPMASSGLFGYMGYDMIRIIENIPDNNPDTLGIPDSIFIRPQILIVFDNIKHTICIITPVYHHAKNADDSSASKELSIARDKISKIIDTIRHPHLETRTISKIDLPITPKYAMSKQDYFSMVKRGQDYINAGDIFQFVPSQRLTVDFDLPAFDLYRSLRRTNPSPFLFYFNFPDFSLIGSSPEILVRVRDKKITIRPIAGTRPRGKTAEEDSYLKEDLLNDPKEIAEHLMLLDLGRNDVGRVAKIGSVNVTDKFITENYSHVMHIVSNVEGDLRDDMDIFDALMSGSPAGTVSGAPKIRAMEIIDELEPIKRKFYGGGVGYLSANNNMDMCIALRTCVVKNQKIYIQAGGGVVADSTQEYEYQETINKSKAIIKAAEDAISHSKEN